MTTSPENAFIQTSKRRISTTSLASKNAAASLEAAFRYEKARPRARTIQSSSPLKGSSPRSRVALSDSIPSKLAGIGGRAVNSSSSSNIDAGHRIHIVKGSKIPVGPKSASSRINLDRANRQSTDGGQQASRDSTSTSTSTFTSSPTSSSTRESTSHPSTSAQSSQAVRRYSGPVKHQQTITANGTKPRSSTSSSVNLNRNTITPRRDTITGHSPSHGTPPVGSALVSAGPAVPSSTTPRRIHIAPLRLVNSNANGLASGAYTSTLPGLSSSNTATTLASSNNWSYGTPATGASNACFNPPLTSKYVPVNPIPTSAPLYQQFQHTYQQQPQSIPNQANQSSPPTSMTCQTVSGSGGGGVSAQVELAGRRRTSDFTIMQVVHPHYAYGGGGGTRNIPPLPTSLAAAAASFNAVSMSPRFSNQVESPYHNGLGLSRSTPASWSASGRYRGYTSYTSGETFPPQQGSIGTGTGWPSMDQHQAANATASMYRTPHMTHANLPTMPTSPAYRFPPTHLGTSPSSATIPTGLGPWQTSPDVSAYYDSMRGSLKRKASLGLIDQRATGHRRRSSGERGVVSGGNSTRASRIGADKLPPCTRLNEEESSLTAEKDRIETASMSMSISCTPRFDAAGCDAQTVDVRAIVPKVEEDEDLLEPSGLAVRAVTEAQVQEDQGATSSTLSEGAAHRDTLFATRRRSEDGRALHAPSSSGLLHAGECEEDDGVAGLRRDTATLTGASTTTSAAATPVSLPLPSSSPLPQRALSAVLEVSFESEGGARAISVSVDDDKRDKHSLVITSPTTVSLSSTHRRALSLPLVDLVAMSTGSSGGHSSRQHKQQRVSRSVGPSSSSKRSSPTSAASNISQLAPIIGLPSPTTPVEAASLQRSIELRDEQRKLIEERRRLSIVGQNAGSGSSSTASAISLAGPASTASRIPLPSSSLPSTSPSKLPGDLLQPERPSSRLAARRGHAAQEKVANLKVSTPSASASTFTSASASTSEARLPAVPLTAPLQRTTLGRSQHAHSQSLQQLGSPAAYVSRSTENSLPFPQFPVLSGSTSSPRVPPSQAQSTIQSQTTANPTTSVNPPSSFHPSSSTSSHRTLRRATISQARDALTYSSSSQPFSGYSTVPPSRGFPSTATKAPHGLASGVLPAQRHPLTGSAQRHHIPPKQTHLHSAPMVQGGSYPHTSSHAHYHGHEQAIPSRPVGGGVSPPTIAEHPYPQHQSRPSKQSFLAMFEQVYDTIITPPLSQEEEASTTSAQERLKQQLEGLLITAELNISKEIENERLRRIEWENKFDNRLEDFKRTLSSEVLFLEKRLNLVEKKQERLSKSVSAGDIASDVTSPSTSRKRSADELEDSDITSQDEGEQRYSSSSNTTTTATTTLVAKGKRRFTTPPELVSLTKRVEVLEANASSLSPSGASQIFSGQPGSTIDSIQEETASTHSQIHNEPVYTTTFRPISSLRGT